jgi:hypothetical protein
MALQNGVLVHGPTAWACAVREPGGAIKVAAARKGFRASAARSFRDLADCQGSAEHPSKVCPVWAGRNDLEPKE